jgi:putative lipoprotein
MLRCAVVMAVALVLLASTARAQEQDPDPWFGRDKALHFAVSASLATLVYAGAALKTEDRPTRVAAAVVVALGAGILKETWDLAGHGDPSWRDLTWDVVGTTTGVLFAYAIDLVIGRLWGPAPAPRVRAEPSGSLPSVTGG